MSDTAPQHQHLLMLTVNFDDFNTPEISGYTFLHCLRGTQIWQVARSERADIVIVRCDTELDFDTVRELRLASPSLPIVIVGAPDKEREALRLRCAFVNKNTVNEELGEAASRAFVISVEC